MTYTFASSKGWTFTESAPEPREGAGREWQLDAAGMWWHTWATFVRPPRPKGLGPNEPLDPYLFSTDDADLAARVRAVQGFDITETTTPAAA